MISTVYFSYDKWTWDMVIPDPVIINEDEYDFIEYEEIGENFEYADEHNLCTRETLDTRENWYSLSTFSTYFDYFKTRTWDFYERYNPYFEGEEGYSHNGDFSFLSISPDSKKRITERELDRVIKIPLKVRDDKLLKSILEIVQDQEKRIGIFCERVFEQARKRRSLKKKIEEVQVELLEILESAKLFKIRANEKKELFDVNEFMNTLDKCNASIARAKKIDQICLEFKANVIEVFEIFKKRTEVIVSYSCNLDMVNFSVDLDISIWVTKLFNLEFRISKFLRYVTGGDFLLVTEREKLGFCLLRISHFRQTLHNHKLVQELLKEKVKLEKEREALGEVSWREHSELKRNFDLMGENERKQKMEKILKLKDEYNKVKRLYEDNIRILRGKKLITSLLPHYQEEVEYELSGLKGSLPPRIMTSTEEKKKSKSEGFVEFLKDNNLYVERSFHDDYIEIERIQGPISDPGVKMYKAKLKSGYFEEWKILKIFPSDERGICRTMNEVKYLSWLKGIDNQRRRRSEGHSASGAHPSIIPIRAIFIDQKGIKDDDDDEEENEGEGEEYGDADSSEEKKCICIETDYYEYNLLFWMKNIKMRYLRTKGELERLQSKPNRQKMDEIRLVFRRILEGIVFLHENNIEHRSLNPQNILINDKNDVGILDFSLSKKSSFKNEKLLFPDESSKHYRAPEEIVFEKDRTCISMEKMSKGGDTFAFGRMLYEAVVRPEHRFVDFETFRRGDSFENYLEHFGFMDLLGGLLDRDGQKRWTAEDALYHDFFQSIESTDRVLVGNGDDSTTRIRPENMELMKNVRKRIFAQSHNPSEAFEIKIEMERDKVVEQLVNHFSTQSFLRRRVGNDYIENSSNREVQLVELLGKMFVIFKHYDESKNEFRQESGIDAGGLSRETFTLLSSQIVESEFVQPVGEKYVLPSDENNYSEYFFNLGLIYCRCFLSGQNLSIPFGPYVYNYLLNKRLRTIDEYRYFMKKYDEEFLRSQMNILKMTNLDFVKDDPETFSFIDGNGKIQFLKMSNKTKFVTSKIKEKLEGITYRKLNLESFCKGFWSVFPREDEIILTNCIRSCELERLMNGLVEVDATTLIQNIEYLNESDPRNREKMRRFLERWIRNASSLMRIKFIHFVTGSNTVSDNGELLKDRKVEKIKINLIRDKKILFAHTCSFTLDCGMAFEDYSEFSDRLEKTLALFRSSAFDEFNAPGGDFEIV